MAWNLLFNSDFGLMSLVVIIGVVVIAGVLISIFSNKIKRSEKARALHQANKQQQQQQQQNS